MEREGVGGGIHCGWVWCWRVYGMADMGWVWGVGCGMRGNADRGVGLDCVREVDRKACCVRLRGECLVRSVYLAGVAVKASTRERQAVGKWEDVGVGARQQASDNLGSCWHGTRRRPGSHLRNIRSSGDLPRSADSFICLPHCASMSRLGHADHGSSPHVMP